jgi:energy-coupling factor transporter transmembrane protein EcfT
MNIFRTVYYSFPVQLLILHFRKYQILLLLWYILFSTVNGSFLKVYGTDTLFLSPEYLGKVNFASGVIVGIATAIFIMSWNITTFILHSHRCYFLATTTRPFLKYCINNSILPLAFLIYYWTQAYHFATQKELIPFGDFLLISLGFIAGFLLLIITSFAYFFTADRRILRTMIALKLPSPERPPRGKWRRKYIVRIGFGMKVGYYLNGLRWKKARDVSHYAHDFLDSIFKRHHFAAMVSILLAFVFMIIIGFFLDNPFFQVPAAASILIFFTLLVALIATLAYFLQSWSILFVIVAFFILNILYKNEIIDPRNRAYGLNYSNHDKRPEYNLQNLQQLCAPAQVEADKQNMINVLNKWRAKQKEEKPLLVFINVSGGGLRSATFTMDVLQRLDSITHGKIMSNTFLISGASGGMLSAAYFRELYREQQKGAAINLSDSKYSEAISRDLLNPIFSSMVSRDIFSPAQKFVFGDYKYVKDRGYAFEQKLSRNTDGVLDKTIADYRIDESNASIPLMVFNSVITRDARKLILSTQAVSFLMQSDFRESDSSSLNIDAIDFAALFKNQNPLNLRLLTALRMNASFPYVLPNVWLPTNPVVDVMDAGIRDNYGQETTLRFLYVFREWIKENTGNVLLIQIRDRNRNGWEGSSESTSIGGLITNPATIFQNNWYKLQDFFQNDQVTYAKSFLPTQLERITFMYIPEQPDKKVPLNFHITSNEKKEVFSSLDRKNNADAFDEVKKYFRK